MKAQVLCDRGGHSLSTTGTYWTIIEAFSQCKQSLTVPTQQSYLFIFHPSILVKYDAKKTRLKKQKNKYVWELEAFPTSIENKANKCEDWKLGQWVFWYMSIIILKHVNIQRQFLWHFVKKYSLSSLIWWKPLSRIKTCPLSENSQSSTTRDKRLLKVASVCW